MTRVQQHHVGQLLIALCHEAMEIRQAEAMSVDLITLSPVRPTPSHSKATPLGLSQATELTAAAAMPVFWLGGMTTEDITTAQDLSAQGNTAITEFWCQ